MRDHPRSRGVYPTIAENYVHREGSSPLARGLHDRLAEVLVNRGIIPARAGFTTLLWRTTRCLRDHPRSRGVYDRVPQAHDKVAGSSPLARGLLIEQFRKYVADRIIPARAGFTETGVTDCSGFWDHPRSRGGYTVIDTGVFDTRGSSPLARGLRTWEYTHSPGRRIIPARAGFTRF